MPEPLPRREDAVDAASLLAEAEALINRACESIDDPLTVNRLKEAQFTCWKVRAERR